MDRISEARRSYNMSRIRSKDTSPELQARRLVHGLGYRYRLHSGDIPGRPDIVFRGRKKVIFVHGCFWHQHPAPYCKIVRRPKSRTGYWNSKLDRNVQRDRTNQAALESQGWASLVIWECDLASRPEKVEAKVRRFLGACTTPQA